MRTVSIQAARSAFDALSPTQLSAPDDLGSPIGYDPGFTLKDVMNVREELRSLADEYGLPSPGTSKGGLFDREACVVIHAGLKATPQAVADDGLWRYLSLAPFAEIVWVRHPWSAKDGAEPRPKLSNYGLGGRFDGLVLRLWMRGDIGQDSDYRYARMGDVDIWRSHLLRVEMGSIRPLAKALLIETGRNTESDHLPTEDLRKLVKNLRACQAFVCAELMDEGEARRFVRDEIRRIKT